MHADEIMYLFTMPIPHNVQKFWLFRVVLNDITFKLS